VQRQAFDAEYIQRLVRADQETEQDFHAYFRELLDIKLRPRLRSPELIEDVIQETFVRVFRTLRRDGIGVPEALGAFVNSVCNNVLFEVYRQQSRQGGPPEDRPSAEAGAHALIEAEEECRQVREVLADLPEKDRKILRWVFFEEREKGEICRTLGVDREYLRVLVHRAKKSFRSGWVKQNATKSARTTPIG
jgi:RNA polymerase sigma-70 factor (ECF subfamily)